MSTVFRPGGLGLVSSVSAKSTTRARALAHVPRGTTPVAVEDSPRAHVGRSVFKAAEVESSTPGWPVRTRAVVMVPVFASLVGRGAGPINSTSRVQ